MAMLKRIAIATSVMMVLSATTAQRAAAADADRFAVIGFNDSASVFVFEVFGTFDALGGGFSTIYFIDTLNDTWLQGTPVRTAVGDGDPELETITLAEIRDRNTDVAAPVIAALGPFDPGRVVASRGFGQLGVNPKMLAWRFPYYAELPGMMDEVWELRIEELPMDVERPLWATGPCMGYAIILNGSDIHRDSRIPRSRGQCPQAYDLDAVICDVRLSVCMAMIAVYNRGFEGLNRSYIAMPFAGPF